MWLTMDFYPNLPVCQRLAWQTGGRCLNLWQVASGVGLCKMLRQGQTYGSFSMTLWPSTLRGREVSKEMREDRGVDGGLAALIYCLKTATIQVGGGREGRKLMSEG